MSNSSIRSTKLSGTIYSSVFSSSNQLILDVRDQEKQTISYYHLHLPSLKLEKIPITNTHWWTKLIAADVESMYFTKYMDRSDPNSQLYLRIPVNGGGVGDFEEVQEIPLIEEQSITYPTLYESGTNYHKTVSDFLGLELPLSCEYLEWGQKIIISYYLRSENEFDRYLLLLDNGKKEWKLHQDHKMNGFSSGAFFIHNDQLLFFKELNEVCIYTL